MIPGERLAEKLFEDQKRATRAGDRFRLSVIRLLRAELHNGAIAKKAPLDGDEELAVLTRELKRRQEALGDYERSGRKDLIEDLNKEIETLKGYLPPQLTADELTGMAREAVAVSGATSKKDLGRVMSLLMPRIRGKADGSEVRRIVEDILD